jgi:hypothetical protein
VGNTNLGYWATYVYSGLVRLARLRKTEVRCVLNTGLLMLLFELERNLG